MHIFICRSCGKLTESETDEKICSSCGAPLDPVKPDSKEAAQARQHATGGPAPIRLPTAQRPASQVRPPQPSAGQTHPPPPRPTSTPPPTPPSPPVSQAPARSTQPRPVALPSESAPAPTAGAQLRTVESGAEGSEEEPAVAGEIITPTQSPVDAGTEGMEVYENKDLVACPQCGYGCDPNWGKCPLCEAPISGTGDLKKVTEMDFTADESSFTKGLVPCPKCQYFCDPSWGTCPICNAELKKSETAEKPTSPEKPDKPEKPE